MQADGPSSAPTAALGFRQIRSDGATAGIAREIAVERPIAIEFNGIGYAVLMATPVDLEDLVYGFALAERLIDDVGDLTGVDCHDAPAGTIIRATLSEPCVPRIMDRVRHRASESSCGLCGIENLEQALRPLPRLDPVEVPGDAAVFSALSAIGERQLLNRATGGVHAAALCGRDGAIRLVREDIGRHNAFDKLIGAMQRGGLSWDGGFALLSSRCSYELVEKAVLSGCPMLATISAPTSLALERAEAAGLRLVVIARPDAMLVPDAGILPR
jgi:FdhD protein